MGRKRKKDTKQYAPEVLAAARLRLLELERAKAEKLVQQRGDPLGFLREHCNGRIYRSYEDRIHQGELYTDDQARIIRSVRDNLVTGVQSANSSGKTWISARVIGWFLHTFGAETDGQEPSCEVYVAAAPPAKNLDRVWSEMGVFLNKFPALWADWQFTTEKLYHLNHPKLFCQTVPIPQNKTPEQQAEAFTGKHARYILFVIDEANSIPLPIWQAMEECMTAGLVVRILYFYNPRTRNSEAYRRFHGGGAYPIEVSAFDHPNVQTGELIIPGAVTVRSVVEQTHLFTRPMSETEEWDEISCFELPDYLVGERPLLANGEVGPPLVGGKRKVTNVLYLHRVLGRAPRAGVNQLIPDEWVARARANHDLYVATYGDNPPANVKGKMGLDMAETTDENAIVIRYGNFLRLIPRWTGVDIPASEEKAAQVYHANNCRCCMIDANGLGAGSPGHLRKAGVNAYGVKVQSKPTSKHVEVIGSVRVEEEFDSLGSQLAWAIRLWLDPEKNPGAMLPPDEDLLNVFPKLVYEKLMGRANYGKIWVTDKKTLEAYQAGEGRAKKEHSPDIFEALKLTFAPEGGGWAMLVQHNGNGR